LPQAAEPVIPTQIQPLPLIGQPGAPAPLANGQPAPAVITPAALVFEAELLTCAFDEAGKLMFKVRGGPKFKRFGVRCWPETLEAAGIDPAALVAGGQYSLAGWVAHWQEGDVAGKGQKVTRLERL
jgi:hypothetical protein